MAYVIFGNRLLEFREELREFIPVDVLERIDEKGVSVIVSTTDANESYLINCLLKLNESELPYETYFLMPKNLWSSVVSDLDVNKLFLGGMN